MVGWGVGDWLIQKSVRKIGATETLFYITAACAILLFPFVYRGLSAVNLGNILFISGIGVITFLGGLFLFKALEVGKLAVVETITVLDLPLTIALGLIFFQERLSSAQIALILLLIVGVVMISADWQRLKTRDFLEKGAILALATAVIVALTNFLVAVGAKNVDPLIVLWLSWLVCALICGVILIRRPTPGFLAASRRHFKLIAVLSLIDILAWICFALAVTQQELAITMAISGSFLVITILLGVIVNREKLAPLQYLGAGIALACSLSIGFF